MSEALAHYHFEAPLGDFSVDEEKGIIKGISLITAGIEARGHKLEVDDKTLEQMLACAEAKKKLPVKWNHKTGADAVSGYLKNFRIVGKKLKGDWHLLKSHERFKHALELATEMPETLGLSVSFSGKDEERDGKKYARCTNLVSADLVASPAANPDGMFEAAVDSTEKGMATPTSDKSKAATQSDNKEFSLADVMAGITALNGRFDAADERFEKLEQFQADLEEAAHDFEAEEEEPEDEDPTEFANFADALTHLEARLQEVQDEKERELSEAALNAFEDKVEGLMELNERLVLENRAMAGALKELSAKAGTVVAFKPSAAGDAYEHAFESTHADGRALTDFESRVAQLVKDGKEETEAILFAIEESEPRYAKHLQSLEGAARSL